MNKKMMIRVLLAVISIALLIVLIFSFIKTKNNENIKHKFDTEPIEPKIKENYNNTSLDIVNSYDKMIYYNNLNNEITISSDDKDINYIIIGKYGNIYKNPITIYNEKDKNGIVPLETYGNYREESDGDDWYFINTKTNKKLDYSKVEPLNYKIASDKYNSNYLVLYDKDKLLLLNENTDKIIELDKQIKNIYINDNENKNDSDYYSNYSSYIIAKNDNNKYGLINYDGDTIIEFKYDHIYNYIDKNEYIACLDNKCGIIDSNDKKILSIEYDRIIYKYDYKILIKNNKIGIMYNNKLIVNYYIQLPNNFDIKSIYLNSNLIIKVLTNDEQEFWSKSKTYIINNNGTVKKVDSYLEEIKYYDVINSEDKIDYFYSLRESGSRVLVTFYDNELYEYYSIGVPYNSIQGYKLIIDKINDTNYYYIKLIQNDGKINKEYIDMFNSKRINEKKAYYQYFSNGYGFTLIDNTLTIYKNNQIIDKYENIDLYLGGYYFYGINKENKAHYVIYELKFNKNGSK